ncbi:fatty acyl-AMP ligase [Nocardia elegans]|uniref:Fatty acyl-AMP ligase n=1 Tax=Nocardia elegans TaxID=300029 RepID=A0ABW6T7Z9_9NOCA|nr:fatty acyl-AMP ligase [Nocardia elegans]MBF6449012.1 fatty acyl-AMP ligase [Nocardia elegans]
MSRFTDRLYETAALSDRGMVTGEPGHPLRRTWNQLHHLAQRMAGALAPHAGAGAKVAVLSADPAEVAPVVQAIWMRAAAATILQQPTPRLDLAHWQTETGRVLQMIEANVLVIGASFDAAALPHNLSATVVRVDDLASGPQIAPLIPEENSVALLQLSSGSTGDPKAVVITHRNLHANISAIIERSGFGSSTEEVAISWLPLSHDMGMIALLAMPMMCGAELISITPAAFLNNPLLWAELISRYRGTYTGAPNFAYSLLGNRLERTPDEHSLDLSSIRYAINGAEPVDCEAMTRFTEQAARFGWPATALAPCYGLAEAVVAVSGTEPGRGLCTDRIDPQKLQNNQLAVCSSDGQQYAVLGSPLTGFEVRVVDPETGASLDTRRVGEFELRGESITEALLTAQGLVPAQDPEGWLRTGDIGYLTPAGELVICGRRKDVIIISGRNLYPTDIERAAERVDGVRLGNVVAVSVAAATPAESFVVLAESVNHGDEGQAVRLRREISMEVFKAIGVPPRTVVILAPGSLPKTTSGKLRRARVRALTALSSTSRCVFSAES